MPMYRIILQEWIQNQYVDVLLDTIEIDNAVEPTDASIRFVKRVRAAIEDLMI